jgi:hypothetical protein
MNWPNALYYVMLFGGMTGTFACGWLARSQRQHTLERRRREEAVFRESTRRQHTLDSRPQAHSKRPGRHARVSQARIRGTWNSKSAE